MNEERNRLLFVAELAREIASVPASELVTMATALMMCANLVRQLNWGKVATADEDPSAEQVLRPEEILRRIQALVAPHGLVPLFQPDRTVSLVRANGSGRNIAIPTSGGT